jgi:hypothetical protein
MNEHKIFVDRRQPLDRRQDPDPCKHLPVDIYHRKRRKATERRHAERSLIDDYMAFGGQTNTAFMH